MKSHLGHYELVAELGRGGMGVVYKGYEPALARYVAIKELSSKLAGDAMLVERFLREARSMASLNDPHIIQIHFIGQENDQPFFVMEFVDGESLAGLLKREGRLPIADALKILHWSVQGLSVAHGRGVIHRDIKPANLMLSRSGRLKIADFGIALANHDFDSKLTAAGEFVGTPGYLSPEVCLGKPVDQRSDIFALGIVLFEMLTGHTPFSGSSPYKLMHDVVEKEIPDITESNPDVESDVVAILAKMLAKDPADRYQSTQELAADLEKCLLVSQGGPLTIAIGAPDEPIGTMVGLSTPHTPGDGVRKATPLPSINSGGGVAAPVRVAAPVGAGAAAKERKPPSATHVSLTLPRRSRAPRFITVAVVLVLAGASWALRNELSELFKPVATQRPVSVTRQLPAEPAVTPSNRSALPTDTGSAMPSGPADSQIAPAPQDRGLAYFEAAGVALLGLSITGFWFGVHRRRRVESAAGVQSLANMKWRDCIGLVLEAMRRDGYTAAPASKQPGDGDTEFLLSRGDERVLLGYKHGTAYRIGETNVRDFASSVQLQGAQSGILLTLGSAEALARDLAKRYGIQLVDGPTLWPKVRQFLAPNTLDHVRLQAAAQTRKGLWIGGVGSILMGVATLVVANQMLPKRNSRIVADTAGAATRAFAAADSDAAAARAVALPPATDTALKQLNATADAMAAVAKLTDLERAQRRANAARQMASIVQIRTAGWPTQSTLLLTLQQSDGADKTLIDEVCRILTQYEELRYTRLQLQPPTGSNMSVRWRQCT